MSETEMKIKDINTQAIFQVKMINIRRKPLMSKKKGLFDYVFDLEYRGVIILRDHILTAKGVEDLKRIAPKFLPNFIDKFFPIKSIPKRK